MHTLSQEEREDLISQMGDYAMQNDWDKAMEIMRQIPIPAYLAKAVKKIYGADFLIKGGYDLSEAEAEYGKDWLN